MIETIKADWPAPAGIEAFCTTRRGGVSKAPYDELNLALHVGDRDADVERNRSRLRRELALPAEPSWINQTHSTRVVTLESDKTRDADAAITRVPGCVAVVMTADCLPILLCNRDASEVAAIHAGWRGLQAGIIAETVGEMRSEPSQLMSWIGPGISRDCFEVGEEVHAAFVQSIANAQTCFIRNRPGHWLCDLAGLAELAMLGLGIEFISRSPCCSFRDDERFYSYRRQSVTGRMASLIWIR